MPAPLVVQKYGGSSVADADRIKRVARRIARERAAGSDLVVVVSAMGDTTDELLGLAAAITDEPDPRELDVLLATGEHQSATLLSMALHGLGVPAISLTGPQAGITTDGRYGRARIAGIEPRRVHAEIAAGKVVIVAGFQGQSASAAADDEITTLGRGGSDTTAVALAASLGADRCQVFTDVKGIYTADPRLVARARQLPVIGYEEMLELAHQGAQVMQVRAVELGWVNGVVIEVLSSFEDAPGTLIKEDPFVEQRNKVRGLAHDRNVAKVTVVAVPDRPGVARSIFDPLAEAGINVDMIVQNVGHGGETDLSFTVPRVELAAAKKTLEPIVRDLGAREMTTDASVAKVSIVGAGLHNAPGYAARMFGTLADTGVNIEMISTSEVRITCMIAEADLETALRALHDAFELERPETVDTGSRGGRMTFLARHERFDRVGSTNDVVRGWLADGTAEVCLAVADEQTAGRGRDGRSWIAPAGGALLLSLGFRPSWLEPDAAWRLAAVASLAMADAAEATAGLAPGTVRLKWPNDLVIEAPDGLRKLAGVLGETDGLGSPDPRVVVGLGINTDWPADAFPPELAASMTSLRQCRRRATDRRRRAAGRVHRASRRQRDGPPRRTVRRVRLGRAPGHDRSHGPPRAPGPCRDRPGDRGRPGHRRAHRRRRHGRRRPAAGPRRRDHPRPARRSRRGGGVTPWPDRHSGRWTVRRRKVRVSSISIATARSSRRHRRTRPGSRPCIGSTWPRCTTTRSTSCATTTRRRTSPNGRSSPP